MEQVLQIQLLAALESSDPHQALYQVVLEWKASGKSQQAVYDVFEEFREVICSRPDSEAEEDIVLEIMDCIVGWCAPHMRLF